MKNPAPKTYSNPPAGALPITREELLAFGITEAEIQAGAARGKLETRGPWFVPVRFTALCVSCDWAPGSGHRRSETVYGVRTLSRPVQSGHVLEGRVSVNGRSVRGFTSSQLFELPDGHLVDVATIHACLS